MENSTERTPVRVVEYAALVLLCMLGDAALYGGSGGLGHLLLFAGAPAAILLARRGSVVSARRWALLALLVLVGGRALWQSSAWGFLVGLGLLFAFAIAADTRESYLPEVVVSSMASLLKAGPTLLTWARDLHWRLTRGRARSLRWVTIVVPVGVVALFALIFVAANPVLERWAGSAWDFVTAGAFFPSGWRLIVWALLAWIAAAWLRPFAADLSLGGKSGDAHTLAQPPAEGPYRTEPERGPRTDVAFATSRNVLACVNVLFLLYNGLDAVHLWAGHPPAGLIHTDYAHRGAAWLTVALLISTVVLSAIFRGALNFGPWARTLRGLAFVWIAQSFVLAAGTLRRIQLYVDDSGLTSLRIIGFLGSALVVVGLGLVAVKVARRKTLLWLVRRQLDAFVLTTVLFTVAPTDALVTWFNVARIERGEYKPLLNVTEQTLTAEGSFGLVPLLRHRDPVVRRGIAAILRSEARVLSDERRRDARWAQMEISRPLALSALGSARAPIDALLGPPHEMPTTAESDARSALRETACRANEVACTRDEW